MVDLHLEKSSDRVDWSDYVAAPLAIGTMYVSAPHSATARWARVRVKVTGADGGATFWIKAVARDH